MKHKDPILQYYIPKTLSKKWLDQYLAAGWFRTVNMLFRSKVSCFDNTLCSPINIRFDLHDHVFSKSLQKLYRRNNALFRFEIKKASITREKEALFQQQQKRFRGFLSNNLEEFLVLTYRFDTYEIDIYDDDRLVAVSYFDDGHLSMMGLLAIFDENYSKYSLGIYSMILEIEYAKSTGKRWYYPGYVHEGPSIYDYKLRFGKAQVYDWNTKRWNKHIHPYEAPNEADIIKFKMQQLEDELKDFRIRFQTKIYLFFGWHYYSKNYESFFHCPLFVQLEDGSVVGYDADTELYICLKWELHIPFRDIQLPLAPDFDHLVHFNDVMRVKEILFKSKYASDIAFYLFSKYI